MGRVCGTDRLQLVRGVIEFGDIGDRPVPPWCSVSTTVHLIDELSTFVLHQIVQRRGCQGPY